MSEVRLDPPSQTTLIVGRGDDPVQAARSICETSFGPERSLSGQRAGVVGRVLCHERHLSVLTATLLEGLEELAAPCPLFDSGLAAYVEGQSRLGLDEGATLIRGAFGAPAGSRRDAREAILAPSVFTNVEPRMALARAVRPAPILCLLRVAADMEATELARTLSAWE